MRKSTCSKCGAPLELENFDCARCYTTALIGYSPKWISEDKLLPAPDPQKPGFSVWVLTAYDDKDRKAPISARYDFNKKKWINDVLLREDFQDVITSFWMPIPVFADSRWIDVSVVMPPLGIKAPATEAYLTCKCGPAYESSLISAFFVVDEDPPAWDSSYIFKKPADGQPNHNPTHWMPLPELPVEEEEEEEEEEEIEEVIIEEEEMEE